MNAEQPPNYASIVAMTRDQLWQRYNRSLDWLTPHALARWLGLLACLALYGMRVWFLQGFYIVTYALGIFLLNNLIGFVTPQVDPDSEGPTLPRHTSDDSKPSFTPRVGEFKFWKLSMEGTAVAFAMTFFSVFNVLVYWPILVLYFILLLVITMQKKIAHMIKHKYIPCSCKTKKQYGGEKGGDKGKGAGGAASSSGAMFSGSSAK